MLPAPSKREAQEAADRIRDFRLYLTELTRQDVLVLSPEQQARLDEHLDQRLAQLASAYDVDITASEKQLSRGMRIISALGGLALCAAVVLLFLRFWGVLTTPLQVGILMAAPVLGVIAMRVVSRWEKTLYITALLGVVTFAAFVLNLTALGGIFNIASSPNAFLAWSAFALFMAYQYGLRLQLAAGIICAVVFFSAKLVEAAGAYWTDFAHRPEDIVFVSAAFLAVPIVWPHRRLAEFPEVYRFVGLLAIFCSLWSLGNSGYLSYLPLHHKTIEALYQVAGFSFAAATIWLGMKHRLNLDVDLGSVFFTVFLFTKFVAWWWDWMPKYLFFFVLGGISLGLLVVFKKLRLHTRAIV